MTLSNEQIWNGHIRNTPQRSRPNNVHDITALRDDTQIAAACFISQSCGVGKVLGLVEKCPWKDLHNCICELRKK